MYFKPGVSNSAPRSAIISNTALIYIPLNNHAMQKTSHIMRQYSNIISNYVIKLLPCVSQSSKRSV